MIAGNIPRDLYDYFDRIYWTKKLGRSPRTKRLYVGAFDRLREFLARDSSRASCRPTIDDLNEETLAGFLSWRLEEKRAPHTVDKERDKFVAILNFAAKRGHIPFAEVPTVDPPQCAPVCWQRDHVVMLLDACRSTPGLIGKIPAAAWWETFHYFDLLVGERTEATLSVRWEDYRGDWITAPAEMRKGRKLPMVYRLPPVLREKLDRFRAITVAAVGKAEGPIFAVPWKGMHKSGSFYIHYTKLLRRAGLPTGPKWKPQCLRRTFGSFLKAAGGDPVKAFGHSSPRIFRESYDDVTVSEAAAESNGALVARELGVF